MNRLAIVLTFLLLAITVCLGQSTPAATPDNSASDSSVVHGVIPVTLAKPVDSKKLKEGDEISAKTVVALRSSSGVTVPLGSNVVGHVTQAKARSKGDPESSLGIAFDKIQLPGGKDMPIKGTLQAVGPNPSAGSGPDTGAAGGNSLNVGNGSTAAAGTGLGLQPGQQQGGGKILNPKSTGVVGIKNLQLDNSVLTSTGKEVKLDQGSQMMIKIE
ncbi:MAG: hypothetical protein ACLPPV_23200 [Candidatus Korobacteraceae bacterium]